MVYAADAGSSDDSGELLRRALGERNVITLDAGRKGGYGAAVNAVLAHRTRALVPAGELSGVGTGGTGGTGGAGVGAGGAAANEWIWLLHDDAAPAPDALQRLMEAVERSTTATVVGCKQLDWDEPRRLVDVGLTATRWFDRMTLIDLDEQDQGQYDARTDVFAVNTAGMLVRRDVWDKLNGLDPALPGPGDDLDFCARARLAGDRVLVVPAAKMLHAVGRPGAQGTATAARKATVFLRLKHAPWWQVPLLTAGAFIAAVYWLFAGFVLKAPGHAVRMFGATCAGFSRPLALMRSRSALAKTRVHSRSAHKGLLAGTREARSHLKSLREAVGPAAEQPDAALNGPSILEPTGDTHHEAITPLVVGKSAPIVGAVGLFMVLTVLSLVTLSRFLGAPALAGGALLPVSEGVGRVWSHATSWWVSLGSGLAGHGDPFNYVLWLLAGAGLGNGSAAVVVVILLAVPISGFTAWLAAGALSRHRWPRIVVALVWAGAPVLQVAVGEGRLGALLAHLLLPLVLLGLIRAAGGAVGGTSGALAATAATARTGKPGRLVKLGRPGVDGNPSWTAAAAAGLVLAAVTAGAPILLPVAVVGIVLATIFLGRRGKTLWWSLLPPLAVYLPFGWSALANPRALLADPGLPVPGAPGPLWQQLLGFPQAIHPAGSLAGIGGLPHPEFWTWAAVALIGAPVVVLAVLALVLPLRRSGIARTLWLVALLGLAAAYAGKLVAVAVNGDTLVTAFNGPAVSLTLLALLGAALLGFDAVHRRAFDPADGGTRVRHGSQLTAVVLSVLLVAAPVASLALWSGQNLTGHWEAGAGPAGAQLLKPVTAGTIPATAADRGTGPEASRTIVLAVRNDSGVQARLMQGDGTTADSLSGIAAADGITGAPGVETLKAPDDATAMLRRTVALMLGKSGIDPRPNLMELGVGFVVLQRGDTAAELLARELEGVPGLATVGPTDSGWLWRVKPTYKVAGATDVVNRVRLVDAKGLPIAPVASDGQAVDTMVPRGAEGRKVVLAERFDAGWSARLDGRELTPVAVGWAQAFELPAAAGELEIHYDEPWSAVLHLAQIVLLGLTLLLAVPVRARRGRTGAYRDEASLQKVGRGV